MTKHHKRQASLHLNQRERSLALGLESLESRDLLAVDVLGNIDLAEGARFVPRDLYAYNDQILIRGNDGRVGPEAWITDGTPESTELLKDIRVGPFGSGPRDFVEFDGGLYFAANNGFNGYELWVTYGTRGTTSLIADIWPGSESAAPTEMVVFQDQLFFFANDGESGRELYRSDGTAIGTERVADSVPGRGGASGENLTVVGDRMFFVSESVEEGQAGLWVSDGTGDGTFSLQVDGIRPDDIDLMTIFGDRLVFASNDQLWVSDGTLAGTVPIEPVGSTLGNDPTALAVEGSRLFVSDSEGLHVISSDFSTVTKIAASADGVVTSNGKAYFWDENGLNVVGVDNQPSQLVFFVSFFGTEMGSTFTVPGGMYFNVNRTLDQYEIWATDGTLEGTTLIETVLDTSAEPLAGFQQIGDHLYFAATNGAFHDSLWRVPAPEIEVVDEPGLPGDVNLDGTVDAADIDAVFAAIRGGQSDPVFDLDEDGDVAQADADYLITEIIGTRAGDANLDNAVDFADFLKLSADFGKESSGWASGDFDGNGKTDFADFLALSSNFGIALSAGDDESPGDDESLL